MKIIKFSLICLITMMLLVWYSCSNASDLNPNHTPNAVFSYTPVNADTSTVFSFDGSESSDMEDPNSALLFTWDFEGQYQWTDPVNSPEANYKFSNPGTYVVCLKVIDTDGWSGEARKDIIVHDSIE